MNVQKWNNDWYFWDSMDSFALVWEVPADAKKIDLPHDAMLLKPAYKDSRNGSATGFRDGGVYSYAKYIDISEDDRNHRLILKFEGIYMNAMIYVNGQLAAKNMFGYTDTYVELNDFLKYGECNEIRVQVRNNGMTNSRWYTGSGIYRDVYLFTGPLYYIIPDGVQIQCEECDADYAQICIRTELKNDLPFPANARLLTEIYDNSGRLAASENVPIVMFSSEKRIVQQKLLVPEPSLWSDESPVLYTCRSTLLIDDVAADTNETTFGIRVLSLDAKRGLRVNGKPVNLRGTCIHHDSGILGAATYEDAVYRQVSRLKEAGFNAVRMSHHPMAPVMLRACDELGMYVMDEAFDMWNRCKSDLDYGLYFNEWWMKDVEAMVRKDYNHPCVLMYSIGNEISEIGTDQGAKVASDISSFIRKTDKTRFVLASINGIFAVGDIIPQLVNDVLKDKGKDDAAAGNVNDFMALLGQYQDEFVRHPIISQRLEKAGTALDLIGYNYMTGRYETDGKMYPNRVIVGSETYPQSLARNWELVEKLSYLIGDFVWTGWDYIGEAGIGLCGYPGETGGFAAGFPTQLGYVGDIDITGFRRPTSYYHEIVYGLRKTPYIAVQKPDKYGQPAFFTPWTFTDAVSTWTWHGYEGKPVIVEVYSAGDEVELVINDHSWGRRPAGRSAGFVSKFETIYEPGTITAITYENDIETGRISMISAGTASNILIKKEDTYDNELIYVDISVTDDNGQVVTDSDMTMAVEVEGDAVILGIGSADPKPKYNYIGNVTDTFYGRAQLILKKKCKSGKAILKIHSEAINASDKVEF